MKRMDDLVWSLNKGSIDDGQRKYFLCELFFTTNYWMRNHCAGLAKQHLEEPVAALRNYVQRALAKTFGCSRIMVPAMLQKHFGCSMTAHGIFADSGEAPRSFEERAKLENLRFTSRTARPTGTRGGRGRTPISCRSTHRWPTMA